MNMWTSWQGQVWATPAASRELTHPGVVGGGGPGSAEKGWGYVHILTHPRAAHGPWLRWPGGGIKGGGGRGRGGGAVGAARSKFLSGPWRAAASCIAIGHW